MSLTASVCSLIGFSSILGEDMDFIFFTTTSRLTLGKCKGEFCLCKLRSQVLKLSSSSLTPCLDLISKKMHFIDIYIYIYIYVTGET